MTSSLPHLALTTGAARAKFLESAYLNNLRLSSSLAQKTETNVKDMAARKKLGIPTIEPVDLYKNTEEKLADIAASRETAVNQLKAILPRKSDAATFVYSLSTQVDPATGLSELTSFNRFFPAFSKEILAVANPAAITSDYLSQLWNSFSVVAQYYQNPTTPGAPINFKDPAAALQFSRLLQQEVEVIKNIATSIPGITPANLSNLENDLDDAAVLGDLPRVNEIGRRVRQALGQPAIAPSLAPASPSPLLSSISSLPPTAPATPSYTPIPGGIRGAEDIKEYEIALTDLSGSFANLNELVDNIGAIFDTWTDADYGHFFRALESLINRTYKASQAKIEADKSWESLFKTSVILLELMRNDISPTDDAKFVEKVVKEIKADPVTYKSPTDIKLKMKSLINSLRATAPKPASKTTPKTGKKKKKSITSGRGVRPSRTRQGSGIKEKVMLGELLAGNDSRALRSKTARMLQSGARI
jgi:hypothetical protein